MEYFFTSAESTYPRGLGFHTGCCFHGVLFTECLYFDVDTLLGRLAALRRSTTFSGNPRIQLRLSAGAFPGELVNSSRGRSALRLCRHFHPPHWPVLHSQRSLRCSAPTPALHFYLSAFFAQPLLFFFGR